MAGSARADVTPGSGAILDNGKVQLGVVNLGDLNICCSTPSAETGTPYVGLRLDSTNDDFTSPGCTCEGWGVADASPPAGSGGPFSGYANTARITNNVTLVSFVSTSDTAISIVDVNDANGVPALQVKQDYHPASATPFAYEDTVTVTNLRTVAIGDLRWRRTFDFDMEPTAFDEYMTNNKGSATNVIDDDNNGFQDSNPLTPEETSDVDMGYYGNFMQVGPFDQGANWDFDFGSLGVGKQVSFNTYYGADVDWTHVINDLAAIGVEAYSIGEPSGDDNPASGDPNSAFFAFSGVGGARAIYRNQMQWYGSAPGSYGSPSPALVRPATTTTSGPTSVFASITACDTTTPTGPITIQYPDQTTGKTDTFKMPKGSTLTTSNCYEDPTLPPAHSGAPFNSQTGSAQGTLNGAPATLTFTVQDGGTDPSNPPSSVAASDGNDKVSFNISQGGVTKFQVTNQKPGPFAGQPGYVLAG
jgi:hypothetical protein